MTQPLRVLQIEDVEDDALLIALELERGGLMPHCTRVETAGAMRIALREQSWDIVISDFGLPHFDAPSALHVLQEHGLDLPFIIVSGTITDEVAVSAMKAGANDFITKTNLKRLVPVVERELREARARREHRRAEESRQHAEARFRTLVQSIDGIVFTVNRRFVIDGVFGRGLANARLEEAALDHGLQNLFGDGEGESAYAVCARAFAGERVVHEWARERPEGVQHLQLLMSPMTADDGMVLGLVGLVRDMSDEKNVQAQLILSDRLASIGALAASVGHEIKNPLAALMANLDAMAEGLQGIPIASIGPHTAAVIVQAREGLEDAREAARRVRQVARDLDVVSGRTDERRESVELSRVLESSVRMAWNEIRNRARVLWDLEPVPPVNASEAQLGQVFLNLLVNAAQAIGSGDPEHNEIRINTHASRPDEVVIAISDTGHGIPDAVRQRLFTPFYTTKPEGAGTGLGLSICKRIVTRFGGTISLDSTVGKGTTFRVTLPAAVAALAAEPAPAPVPVAAPAPPLRRGRVLIVDDEAIVCRAIQRILTAHHEVETVNGGLQAFELITGGRQFDVVLCDLNMPDMTGIELYAALTSADPRQADRVVFLTGGVLSEGTRSFLDAIPNLKLEKPFDSRRLLEVVAERIVA